MSQPVNKSAPSASGSKTKPARHRAKASLLSIAYPDACGIDIGATSHFVAVPPERDDEPVREFPALTADLERLVQWLRRCRVTAVAMESTGVYWIPLFEMLDAAGFEVHLVNARHLSSAQERYSPDSYIAADSCAIGRKCAPMCCNFLATAHDPQSTR
jgi:hypothetical protein